MATAVVNAKNPDALLCEGFLSIKTARLACVSLKPPAIGIYLTTISTVIDCISPFLMDSSPKTLPILWQPLGLIKLYVHFLGLQRDGLTLVIEVKCFLYLSSYTYEVSPVFLLVEEAVLKKMIEFIGWKEGDGIFNPGKYN